MKISIIVLLCTLSLTFGAKKTFNAGGFAAGQNVGAGVNNLIGAKVSAIGGFFAGLVTGQSANTGQHYSGGGNTGYTSGCGSHGGGGCNSYVSSGSNHHGSSSSGSSYTVCKGHGCGGSTNYHAPAPAPAPSYNNYPDCQCDWLFNDHGQGNCNGNGASSHTNDRWCYVKTKVNHKWVDPQWACPDSQASTVHHGRYWSNIACNTPQHG